MKCANVSFSLVPRISAGDAENSSFSLIWSSVFAYVWLRMLFFPLAFTFNTLHDLLKVIIL